MALVHLMSCRGAVIDGNDSILHVMGCGNVTVNGNLQSVTYTSSGNLTINGSVLQDVQVMGRGTVKINGNVKGKVCQLKSGNLHIIGDVYGDITQMGTGDLTIEGTLYGKAETQGGTGRIILTAKKKPRITFYFHPNSQVNLNNLGNSDSILPRFRNWGQGNQNLTTVQRILFVLFSLLLLWAAFEDLVTLD